MHNNLFPVGHGLLNTRAIWFDEKKVSRQEFAIVLFRKTFTNTSFIDSLKIWITASQRFILFLDGEIVGRGPSRSDPSRWNAQEINLTNIKPGNHVLAACVYNYAQHSGIGQMGNGSFFLLYSPKHDALSENISTSKDWKCYHDISRSPTHNHIWNGFGSYYVVGCGEIIDSSKMPWGWEQKDFNDTAWVSATEFVEIPEDPWGNIPLGHDLRPDPLPMMDEKIGLFKRIFEVKDNNPVENQTFLTQQKAITLPANTISKIILDRGELTNAYWEFTFSQGKDAKIDVINAEAPYIPGQKVKGNRDDVYGKEFRGHHDIILHDGNNLRTYSTLWFRSFRYIELTITTSNETIVFESAQCKTTGFPLHDTFKFSVDSDYGKLVRKQWEMSFRTIQLCAHETFFDCPHYEQAQFPGDTRVQAIYHYLICNEDRLARKAIDDFHASRNSDGLTQCRYPSRRLQILPTFSLFWIGMLHDYIVYRGDKNFITPYLSFAREILDWFERRRRKDGLLGRIEYAPFTDWTPNFSCGNAPQDQDGGSSILTLLYAMMCEQMAQLETWAGYPQLASVYKERQKHSVDSVMNLCYEPTRKFIADTASKKSYSIHAQVLGVLANCWNLNESRNVLEKALDDTSITPIGTPYFRYYLAQSLKKTNLHERIFDLLAKVESLFEGTGLTTWPETDSKDSRSDCHAWSVTPSLEFIETILGIRPDPASEGFEKILIRPTPGPLKEALGELVIPQGMIKLRFQFVTNQNEYNVEFSTPVKAFIVYMNKWVDPGTHKFTIKV